MKVGGGRLVELSTAAMLTLLVTLGVAPIGSQQLSTAQQTQKFGMEADSTFVRDLQTPQYLYEQMQKLGWTSFLFQLGRIRTDNHPNLMPNDRTNLEFIKQVAGQSPNPNYEFWYGTTVAYGWNDQKWWDLVNLIGQELASYPNIKVAYAYVHEFFGSLCATPCLPTPQQEAAGYDRWVLTSNQYGKTTVFRNEPQNPSTYNYRTQTWNIATGFRTALNFVSSTPLPADEPTVVVARPTWIYTQLFRLKAANSMQIHSGQWAVEAPSWLRYTNTKAILQNMISQGAPTFHFSTLIDPTQPLQNAFLRKGFVRAHEEVLLGKYVNPANGLVFGSASERDLDWKSTAPYLTLSISPSSSTASVQVPQGSTFELTLTVQNIGAKGDSFEILLMINSLLMTTNDPLRVPFTIVAGETKLFKWNISVSSTSTDRGDDLVVVIFGGKSFGNPFGKLYDWEYNDLWVAQRFLLVQTTTTTTSTTTSSTTTTTTLPPPASTTTTTTTSTTTTSTTTSTTTTTTLAQTSFDFTISVEPASTSVTQGNSVRSRVTVTWLSGSPEFVWLGAGGLPSGASATFSNLGGTPTFTSELTITTTPQTPPGIYTVTITGTSSQIVRTALLSLTINPYIPPTYSVKILASPLEGGSTNPLPGTYSYAENTQLTISALPFTGWSLNQWLVNGQPSGNGTQITVIVNQEMTVEASFINIPTTIIPTYTVSISTMGPNSTTITIDTKEYRLPVSFQWQDSSTHFISAHPIIMQDEDVRYVFTRWSGSFQSDNLQLSINVDRDHYLILHYRKQFLISLGFTDASGRNLLPSDYTTLDETGSRVQFNEGNAWINAYSQMRVLSAIWMNTNVAGPDTTFVANRPGEYVIQLRVFDQKIRVVDIFGSPIPGVAVEVISPGGTKLTKQTDTNGIAEFASLPLGTFSGSATFLGVSIPFSSERIGANEVTVLAVLNYPLLVIVAALAASLALRTIKRRRKKSDEQESSF